MKGIKKEAMMGTLVRTLREDDRYALLDSTGSEMLP